MSATKSNPQALLQQAAQIARLERGKLSIIREGLQGPFYNHQYRQDGKNLTRYVPRGQVPAVQQAIDGYAQFRKLVEQYVNEVVEATRAEIAAGSKKNLSHKSRPNSSSPKKRKSGS